MIRNRSGLNQRFLRRLLWVEAAAVVVVAVAVAVAAWVVEAWVEEAWVEEAWVEEAWVEEALHIILLKLFHIRKI
jgi:hypothetical protein